MFPDEFKNKPSFLNYRKKLRKESTQAEKILWQKLRKRQLGIKFRRQFEIKNYIVDFYCHEKKLIIEIDGYIHGNEKIKSRDLKRQISLEENGFKVIRYRNEQVLYELSAVVQDIFNNLNNPS